MDLNLKVEEAYTVLKVVVRLVFSTHDLSFLDTVVQREVDQAELL